MTGPASNVPGPSGWHPAGPHSAPLFTQPTGFAPAPGPRQIWPLVWAAGVTLLLAGTFLPWLYSGRVAKNSYQLAGVGQRRIDASSWLDALLSGWPYLGPAWAVALVLLLVKLRRTAAATSIVLGVIAGLVAGAVLLASARLGDRLITAAWSGPALTAIGALLVITASVGLLRRKSHRIGANAPTWAAQ